MDFSFTPEQEAVRSAVERICARFGDDYWLKKDKEGGFPHDFHKAFADDGWLGICVPQEYGGAGCGAGCATAYLRRFTATEPVRNGPPVVMPTQNLIGVIPGTDPTVANEYVMIGAHFDHLGRSTSGAQIGRAHV